MSRYELPEGDAALYEPGSDGKVLRNRLGITDKSVMDQTEFEALLQVQEAYTARISADTQFDVALLRQMHRDWLGDIYDWAGAYRRVNLSKGEFQWPPWARVEENMKSLEEGVLRTHTPCAPGDVAKVARAIAEVHGDLLLVHPFLDGNGRLARWLAELMALQASLPLPDYGFTEENTAEHDVYIRAVTQAYAMDYEALSAFFERALARGLETSD